MLLIIIIIIVVLIIIIIKERFKMNKLITHSHTLQSFLVGNRQYNFMKM